MRFTPIEAVLGGLAIGLATFWNARLNGTVTGISGELSMAIAGRPGSSFFILGLISAGLTLKHVIPTPFATDVLAAVPLSTALLAGFLVGFGTRLGNGCTSGHGVCGLSRFSPRSLVSTATFMAIAMATATLLNSLSRYPRAAAVGAAGKSRLALSAVTLPPRPELPWMLAVVAAAFALPSLLGLLCALFGKQAECRSAAHQALQFAIGFVFGGGLIVSGMAAPSKTVAFLDLGSGAWDPSLLFVFVGALPVAIAGFWPLMHGVRPILATFHSLPTKTDLDWRLVSGATLFGVGWGLLGLCPGPALVYLGAFPGTRNILAFCSTLAVGSVICTRATDALQKCSL